MRRTLVFGDIHGGLKALIQLLDGRAMPYRHFIQTKKEEISKK